MSDNNRADQIRARLAAATPGPWSVAGWYDKTVITTAWAQDHGDPEFRGPFMSATTTTARDANLIANAPADLAWLLAERADWIERAGSEAQRADEASERADWAEAERIILLARVEAAERAGHALAMRLVVVENERDASARALEDEKYEALNAAERADL